MIDMWSQNIFQTILYFQYITSKICLSHNAYIAQQVVAIYSTSIVKSATIDYFFNEHKIALVLR